MLQSAFLNSHRTSAAGRLKPCFYRTPESESYDSIPGAGPLADRAGKVGEVGLAPESRPGPIAGLAFADGRPGKTVTAGAGVASRSTLFGTSPVATEYREFPEKKSWKGPGRCATGRGISKGTHVWHCHPGEGFGRGGGRPRWWRPTFPAIPSRGDP